MIKHNIKALFTNVWKCLVSKGPTDSVNVNFSAIYCYRIMFYVLFVKILLKVKLKWTCFNY